MAQVFSQSALSGDIWDMQGAVIQFGSAASIQSITNAPMATDYNSQYIVAIGLQLGFSQSVSKRYPINVRRVIYMLGSPDGTVNINCLFGPGQSMANFLQTFGATYLSDSRKVDAAIIIKPFGTVTSSTGSSTLSQGIWSIKNPVVTSVGLTISEGGGNGAVQAVGQVSLTFNNLDIS